MSEPAEESGAQLLARLASVCRPQIHNLHSTIFPNNGPYPKEIVEISGDTELGKTTLNMHIMAKVILPMEYGGKDGMVIFLLTDHNFDMDKFIEIIEKYVKECDKPYTADIIMTSLENITIQRCFDEAQFEFGIYGLDAILNKNKRYCLLALDSIGAFYYTSQNRKFNYVVYMKDLLQRLKRIIHDNHLVLVFTKPAYFTRETNRIENVDYFIELVDKGNETDSNLEYIVDIPKLNQKTLLQYGFDANGCIVWKK